MFFQQLINGLMLGSVYALVALGYTMVYGVMKFINFAHGDVYMWGGFIGLFLARLLGGNYFLVLILTMILTGILGVLVERIAYKPLRKSPRLVVTTSALGMSIVLSNLALLLIGSETYPMPKILAVRQIHLGSFAVINTTQILVLVIAVILMFLLNWFVNHTRYGQAIRATSEDSETAGLMGISMDQVLVVTFFVGSALGGAAGLLVGTYYDAIYSTMGYAAGLKAFTAAILGGIGSIPGAMVGGLVLGVVENFAGAWIPNYRDGIAFIVMVLVLLFKPGGLFNANIYQKRV
ncbi:branched-chain amino acid ABC transporter permease [Desulfosporosinus sp. PR]|uniref:branched-chain amino acid ABC transporter permease n=1 Tax=Candidatus Desulfosporosinus nitrosoreducens TaxID=3401928 RepID=UPI0027E7C908|nr:branched-chain amino acid ABC transporter permease [Desulfosporosinus sp. PR]MDQ7093313.1 branched-chain amino acid ABC transporter permease [Desulfosporosinus sp. PR]